VAHARLVDYRRRSARTPQLTEFDPLTDDRLSSSAEDEVLGSLGGMSSVLAMLHEDQREVLVLRIVADLSVEQVAGIMEKTPGAIKQLQRRGLIALRELVKEKDHAAS
jgi:RNA polymerase sigma-70 factor (ECF subfamily)